MAEQDEEKFTSPPFSVTPKNLGSRLRFSTYVKVSEWAEKEHKFWKQLDGITEPSGNWGNQISNHIANQFHNLHRFASEAQSGDQAARNGFRNVLLGIENGIYPVSEDTTGRIVENLLLVDPERAVAHAAIASNAPFTFPAQASNVLNAIIDAKLDGVIDQDGIDAREETLTRLRKRWDARFRKLAEQQQSMLNTGSSGFRKGVRLARKGMRRAKGSGLEL